MRWILVVWCLALASVSTAQTIHQYPYDASVKAYANQAAWPTLSAQCHWRPANNQPDVTPVPQLQSASMGHIHIEPQAPIYGEFANSFVVPFKLVLFHVQGSISPGWGGVALFGSLLDKDHTVWDTPDGTQPVMTGDPNGVKSWTGHVTVDFSRSNPFGNSGNRIPAHGWFMVQFGATAVFDNGDQVAVQADLPFYSMMDPTAAEEFMVDPGSTAVECFPSGPRIPTGANNGFGEGVLQYKGYLPILAPITSAIPTGYVDDHGAPIGTPGVDLFMYNYQDSTALPRGHAFTRFDVDLHNGIPGALIAQGIGDPIIDQVHLPSPFDPAVLGAGTHKVVALWFKDSGDGSSGIPGNQQASTLLTVTVAVGAGIPVPAPTLASLTPNQATAGQTLAVVMTGTHFVVGATSVTVSGAGVMVMNTVVQSATSLTATVMLDAGAPIGPHSVGVTTPGGASNSLIFTVTGTPTETWSTWILQHGNLSGTLRACPDASGVGCVGVMKQ